MSFMMRTPFDAMIHAINTAFNFAVDPSCLLAVSWFETQKDNTRSLSLRLEDNETAKLELVTKTLDTLRIPFNIRRSEVVGGDRMLSVEGEDAIEKLLSVAPRIKDTLGRNNNAVVAANEERVQAMLYKRHEEFNARAKKDKAAAIQIGGFPWAFRSSLKGNMLFTPLESEAHRHVIEMNLGFLGIDYEIQDVTETNLGTLQIAKNHLNKLLHLNPEIGRIAEENTAKAQRQAIDQVEIARRALRDLSLHPDADGRMHIATRDADANQLAEIRKAFAVLGINHEPTKDGLAITDARSFYNFSEALKNAAVEKVEQPKPGPTSSQKNLLGWFFQ
jgi:hypothetical protein